MRTLAGILTATLLLGAAPVFAQGDVAEPSSEPSSEPPPTSREEAEILETVPVDEEGTEVPPPNEEQSLLYSAIGAALVSADFKNVKDAVTLDITLIGFRLPNLSWLGIELNFGTTILPGQVTEVEPGEPGAPTGCGTLGLEPCPGEPGTSSESDFAANYGGLYAVVRSPTRFYGMAKLGYRYADTNLPELAEDRSGSAWGIGGGYRFGASGFAELQYTQITDDLTATGLQVTYGFGRR